VTVTPPAVSGSFGSSAAREATLSNDGCPCHCWHRAFKGRYAVFCPLSAAQTEHWSWTHTRHLLAPSGQRQAAIRIAALSAMPEPTAARMFVAGLMGIAVVKRCMLQRSQQQRRATE
jgi:hypothetical protein